MLVLTLSYHSACYGPGMKLSSIRTRKEICGARGGCVGGSAEFLNRKLWPRASGPLRSEARKNHQEGVSSAGFGKSRSKHPHEEEQEGANGRVESRVKGVVAEGRRRWLVGPGPSEANSAIAPGPPVCPLSSSDHAFHTLSSAPTLVSQLRVQESTP